MRVLVSIDDSDCSAAAVDFIGRYPWPEGTIFKVITVVEPIHYEFGAPGAYMASVTSAEEKMIEMSQDLVDSKVSQLRKFLPGSAVEGRVIGGPIANSIIDEAKDWQADMVVVGWHGRRGLEKWILGSVAERVAAGAPCSIQIVKADLKGGQKETKHAAQAVSGK